jgi:hypothetical protein
VGGGGGGVRLATYENFLYLEILAGFLTFLPYLQLFCHMDMIKRALHQVLYVRLPNYIYLA